MPIPTRTSRTCVPSTLFYSSSRHLLERDLSMRPSMRTVQRRAIRLYRLLAISVALLSFNISEFRSLSYDRSFLNCSNSSLEISPLAQSSLVMSSGSCFQVESPRSVSFVIPHTMRAMSPPQNTTIHTIIYQRIAVP